MPSCIETKDGYLMMGGDVHLQKLKEVVVLVDVKKGLAFWSGARETVEVRFDSLKNRCKGIGILDQFDRDIKLLALPGDVSIDEMNWMINKRLLPRRVAMRIKNGER